MDGLPAGRRAPRHPRRATDIREATENLGTRNLVALDVRRLGPLPNIPRGYTILDAPPAPSTGAWSPPFESWTWPRLAWEWDDAPRDAPAHDAPGRPPREDGLLDRFRRLLPQDTPSFLRL